MAFPIEGPVWLVGAGNMGGAMLRRWLDAGLDPAQVTVIRRTAEPVAPGVTVLTMPPPDGPSPTMLMLAVKPQALDQVAPLIAPALATETLLVSILAGVETASLRARFPNPSAIVRAMPNTPVAIGKGVVALGGEGLDPVARRLAEALMAPLGLVEWVDEALFDAVTALAGSGPAFLFRFIDALGAAGASIGLPADQAARLALATVEGSALLAATADESPALLADRVASPGGSTRKGLDVLDEGGALVKLLSAMLAASARRNAELAEAARNAA
ncbi:pyrroline-5-carboxylate reductase [Sphingomonas oleivorans]|uniref:Pyrroline-5-carboxylate reductase n=1 Tax=Sphingomonas oleivorans TaxID=1735121 RepID=A0A2T5FYA4_9SPHN|nr:pyrroline-5-carboxylate reductase [Sphingomonas oleivorans]PTQ11511.1 pyrroline-5-carboxylate reductase [Sphingomonas oleivorans]